MTTILEQKNPNLQTPPPDLRQDLGNVILLKLALDAVQALDSDKVNAAGQGMDKLRPQMMLTLLAFSYAARIYASRDIEWAVGRDPTVHYICARTFPGWQAIRRFRRSNRELIEQALTYVLRKGLLLQAEQPSCESSEFPVEDLSQLALADARSRIEAAIITDMAESD